MKFICWHEGLDISVPSSPFHCALLWLSWALCPPSASFLWEYKSHLPDRPAFGEVSPLTLTSLFQFVWPFSSFLQLFLRAWRRTQAFSFLSYDIALSPVQALGPISPWSFAKDSWSLCFCLWMDCFSFCSLSYDGSILQAFAAFVKGSYWNSQTFHPFQIFLID